jgi:hypothetical protein
VSFPRTYSRDWSLKRYRQLHLTPLLVLPLAQPLAPDPVPVWIGWLITGVIFGLIPLGVGLVITLVKRRNVPLYIGIGGFVACAVSGLALGICLAVPVSIGFLVGIWVATAVSAPRVRDYDRPRRPRRPRRREDGDADLD